ncbi:hypothetical protein ACTQ29_08115 [Bifidobacterium boum]|uniref:hypothetical protein n=1 Tax=Bifidobacterium boum TaxID=78343 RepID=UPI003F8F9648
MEYDDRNNPRVSTPTPPYPLPPRNGRAAARYWENMPDDNYTSPNYHKRFDWLCFGRILLVIVLALAGAYILYLAYYFGMLMLLRGRSFQEIYSSDTPEVNVNAIDYVLFFIGIINILIAVPVCRAVGMRGRHPSKVLYWRDRPEIEPMVAAWAFGKRTFIGSGIASLIDKGGIGVDQHGHVFLQNTPTQPLTRAEHQLLDFLVVAFHDFYREHPNAAGMPGVPETHINPSVAELTDHLSADGYQALSRVQSEVSRQSGGIMRSLGAPRAFMLIGCAFISGAFSILTTGGMFLNPLDCASLTQVLIRYEGFTWLNILVPIANLMTLVYAAVIVVVVVINTRNAQHIRNTGADGKHRHDLLRNFLVAYCIIALPLSPIRPVGMVLTWYLLIEADIPTKRIDLPMMRLYHHVLGLGKYLKDYSDLSERGTTRDAQLYGWNLAYAVALGLAKGELASVDRMLWKRADTTAHTAGRHTAPDSKGRGFIGTTVQSAGIPLNPGIVDTDALNSSLNAIPDKLVTIMRSHGIEVERYDTEREAISALVASGAADPKPDDNTLQKSVRTYLRWLNQELEKQDHDEPQQSDPRT